MAGRKAGEVRACISKQKDRKEVKRKIDFVQKTSFSALDSRHKGHET
jgi:hypothetical protein